MRRRNQKGFSLVEAAIVLGLVGGVVGGIWKIVRTVQQNQRRNEITSTLLAYAERLKTLYPPTVKFINTCTNAACITDMLTPDKTALVDVDSIEGTGQPAFATWSGNLLYRSKATGIYYETAIMPANMNDFDVVQYRFGPLNKTDCKWLIDNNNGTSGQSLSRFYSLMHSQASTENIAMVYADGSWSSADPDPSACGTVNVLSFTIPRL